MKKTTRILYAMMLKGCDREYTVSEMQLITDLTRMQIIDSLRYMKNVRLIKKRYEVGYKDNYPFRELFFKIYPVKIKQVRWILKKEGFKI